MNRFTSLIFTLGIVASLLVSCANQPQSTPLAQNKVEAAEIKVSTPLEAKKQLELGNQRFVKDSCQFPHHDHLRVEGTSEKQNPYATIVGCSDSRVPIELIFDQGIGDIFVIRTAGNSVNDDVILGSIDYSVLHLDVKLVVILGHESCGGVTGAIASADDNHHAHDQGQVEQLLQTIRNDVKEYVGKPEQVDEAIRCNVFAQVERLRSLPHLKKRIEEGKLEILPAYYNIHTGSVTYL